MANIKLTRSTCGAQPAPTPTLFGIAPPAETHKRVVQRLLPPHGAQPEQAGESEDDMERARR
jgi:hypothetical protein